MTDPMTTTPRSADAPWTCPFCPLTCDAYGVEAVDGRWQLRGSDCPRAQAALSRFGTSPSSASPLVDGQPVALDAALYAAAALLGASRQPLFGGLATDVAGARALYPLAVHTGAIVDAAGGAALMATLRSTQDRGNFTTTLAEVRNRGEVIVCVGGSPTPRLPEFFRRCGVGDPAVPQRHLVGLGGPMDAALASVPGVSVETIAADGADLLSLIGMLDALAARRIVTSAPPALVALAERLRAARYSVVAWEAAEAGPGGALLAEAVGLLVATLNRSTRAGALPLGGGDGMATVNQVWTWLSGLPLRSRAGPLGLEHQPVAYDTARLLADRAVDALLWIASYGTEPELPATDVPIVVLGHPDTVLPPGVRVFIPVATPGVGAVGHLFRSDGVVLMPLQTLYTDTLPGVDAVARALTARLASVAGLRRAA